MIRWKKAATIARFELVSTVRRLGYLVVTLGMPLFAIVYGALALTPGYLALRTIEQGSTYGVVDHSGLLRLAPGDKLKIDKATFRVYESEQAATRALRDKRGIKSFFVLEQDYLKTGRVSAHADETAIAPWHAADEVSKLVRSRLLAEQIGPELSARVLDPVPAGSREAYRFRSDGSVVHETKESIVGRIVLPLGFVLLLFTSILMSGSYLIQATATEKENKVIEVLLSSASVDEVMTGKLLGLGGAGLLQVTVWITMMVGAHRAFSVLVVPLNVEVSWQAVVLSPILFVAAYLFLGSLMLGTGSLGGNVRESQQLGMLWALVATLPLVFLPMLAAEPHSPVATLLTWIPFSTPATLMMRTSLDPEGMTIPETIGPLAMLVMSTWVSVRMASRIFRLGLLAGSRPKLKDIWRHAKP